MSPEQFSAEQILELLADLGSRIQVRGQRAALFVFGGAAVAVRFDSRRSTADVDALMRPAAIVNEIAGEIAADRGLRPAWLNASGAGFVPDLPDDWQDDALDLGGLKVVFADTSTLIAMKMLSTRSRDVDDLVVLFRAAGLTTPEEAVAIFRQAYPHGTPGRNPSDEELRIDAEEILDLVARKTARPDRHA